MIFLLHRQLHLKDISVGYEDIDLGALPAKEQTLTISFENPDQLQDSIKYFHLLENKPEDGTFIYWKDEPELEMPYEISVPEPGLYYAIVQQENTRTRYQYPIEISEGQKNMNVTLPIQKGKVTITGALPKPVSYVYFTNSDQTISGTISNNKNNGGSFEIDGLFPGTYYLNPKWPNFSNCITVIIPDSTEYTLNFDATELIEKLKDRVSVQVLDKSGKPVEHANVWIERDNKYLLPATHDNYSSVFYLPDGEHFIQAEKDGISAITVYHVDTDKNNTTNGESFETFIQLK